LQRVSELIAERERHRVGAGDRDAALAHAAERGLELSGEQRAAFDHVTGERDLSLVVGYAGTGKSAMLGVAREAWERAGYEVRGAALSGIAAEGLENGSGIASRTIASMEHGWAQGRDMITSRDVLIIDEAGMVGTRQMERVLSHVADAGAKVVLVGDPQQLQAIEAGAAFRAIHERHGGVEITEVRRQHEGWQQQATRHLATGRTGEAIDAYAARGMVHAAETREAARGALIERWDRDRQANPDASRIILTHTNAEVRELNEGARDAMRASGDLGADVRLKVERGDRDFATGDRIMFLRNERSLEVKNGTLGTIERVSEQHMTVRTDDGRSVTFDVKDYRDLDHGYAATIHKAQGMTVNRAHMLATPGGNSHLAYVGLSRHRERVDLYYARKDFANQNSLVRALSRDGAKDMASDYAARDPAQQFAERRGIGFGERVAKIIKAVPEKARGIFDGLRLSLPDQQRDQGMFAGFRPPDRAGDQAQAPPSHVTGQRRAVERYARAVNEVARMHDRGLPVLPHQHDALNRAGEALDAIRPHASTDLANALQRQPELIHEAAKGRGQAAVRAMNKEAELRVDPFQRADRFVEGWQQLRQAHEDLRRDGDVRGAKRVGQELAGMAKSLERDAQMESLLRGRRHELGIGTNMGRDIAHDLAASVPVDRARDLGMSR